LAYVINDNKHLPWWDRLLAGLGSWVPNYDCVALRSFACSSDYYDTATHKHSTIRESHEPGGTCSGGANNEADGRPTNY